MKVQSRGKVATSGAEMRSTCIPCNAWTLCIDFLDETATRTNANLPLTPRGCKPLAFLDRRNDDKDNFGGGSAVEARSQEVAWSRMMGNVRLVLVLPRAATFDTRDEVSH